MNQSTFISDPLIHFVVLEEDDVEVSRTLVEEYGGGVQRPA